MLFQFPEYAEKTDAEIRSSTYFACAELRILILDFGFKCRNTHEVSVKIKAHLLRACFCKSLEQFRFVLEGEFEERMAALQIEFLADILPVFFDGSRADENLFADFPACHILGNQF